MMQSTEVSTQDRTWNSSQGIEAARKRKATMLARYQLVRRLERVDTVEVFRARCSDSGDNVAIRVLSRPAVLHSDLVDRFLLIHGRFQPLRHPLPVDSISTHRYKGIPYAVTEFVGDNSLQTTLDRSGCLSVGDALYVTMTCAESLRHLCDC